MARRLRGRRGRLPAARDAPRGAGIWASSFALGFHPVNRHDGVLSVPRGYCRAELADLVRVAVGQVPVVRDRIGFRVTAVWTPTAGLPATEIAT